MAVRCAEKNRHVFFDLYPWTSRIQTGKKHGYHYLDLCNVWCLWVIMNHLFACFLGYGWREMQEFSQIEQAFRKKWVARRTSTRWNTRYIIDPSSEMLWARIQYSRYIPGIFQVYSRYIVVSFHIFHEPDPQWSIQEFSPNEGGKSSPPHLGAICEGCPE